LTVLCKKNKTFTAEMLAKCLKISEKGGYYHISKHLIPYGLIEELPEREQRKKRLYRLTKFGKEFLFKLFSRS
jgi:predicted ArsR family transcriptional regulator